ncbi:MAG: hypothetical protein RIF33_00580 [Cyclobacteriaceae bacterium]
MHRNKKARIVGSFNAQDGTQLGVSVPVILFEDEGLHFMMCPPLDITGYGDTPEEAEASYKIMMDEFLDYTLKKKTLIKELTRLGWKVKKNNLKKPVQPPTITEVAKHNQEVNRIINEINYQKVTRQVAIPA